jgi:hypothetical protein
MRGGPASSFGGSTQPPRPSLSKPDGERWSGPTDYVTDRKLDFTDRRLDFQGDRIREGFADGSGKAKASRKSKRKPRVEVTAELVARMKEAIDNKGDESRNSIAKKLGVSIGTLISYEKRGFKFAPKKKGRKAAKK